MNWDGVKLGWCMPLDWSHINKMTHISTLSMNKPDVFYCDTGQSGDVAEKRENQVEEALNAKCTHIVMLDGDMVYYPEILEDLFTELSNGADLAGGLCYRGNPPYDPLIWHPTEERLLIPFKEWKPGDTVDAGATGAACLLVKREVFEKISRPWFRFQTEEWEDGHKIRIIRRGEDTYFTRKATRAGFKLRIITKEDIGHMREFQIDRAFWLLFGIVQNLKRWEVMAELFKKTCDVEWLKREFPQLTIDEVSKGGKGDA